MPHTSLTLVYCQHSPQADHWKLDSGGAGDLGTKVSGGTLTNISRALA